ncbi:helix-turn-helix domain-containing protein [Hydrogenimonas sp.]
MDKRWMSQDDLEKEFGFKKPTQQKYRTKRKIPFVKIGGFIYYDRKKIEEWLERHAIEADVW